MDFEFRFHHIGAAVNSIDETLKVLKQFLGAELLSDPIFDPLQNANLILVKVGGLRVELVSGEKVSRFLSQEKGLSFYHVCYEVKDFDKFIEKYRNIKGVILVSSPQPAILFNYRRVVFFMMKGLGLVEILEGIEK